MRIVIALPALNEEQVIAATVRAVRLFADAHLAGHEVTIIVADNGSTDRTGEIAAALAAELPGVRHLALGRRGKGLAIREAWRSLDADVYVFMDADLSVGLSALPGLVERVAAGAGLAVGSRYHADSTVSRSAFRRLLSLGYRGLVGVCLGTDVADAPCGFKAASAAVVDGVLPSVRDDRWFFDTELVIRAERAGHRVEEMPVTWTADRPGGRESKVRVPPLVGEYLGSVIRLRREIGPREAASLPGASMIPAPSSFRALRETITRGEWRLAFGAATVVALLGLVAPLIGTWWASRHGWEWTGRQFLAPGDFSVYLSYIAQARDGAWLLQNASTTEPLVPVFNALWWLVGLMARAFHLTPLVAFHVSRTLLIFPFAAVAYAAAAYAFRHRRARVTAFLLFMFGSGVGLLASPLLQAVRPAADALGWPIDFWVAESNAFMTMLYSPHFTASFALIVAAMLALMMAYDAERPRYGAVAGLLGLVLFQFHPFHVPTLWGAGFVALAWITVASGFRVRQWLAFTAFAAISAPSVAYHWWLTHLTPNAAFMLHNNVNLTPAVPYVLMGFGAASVLAVFGWLLERHGRTDLLTPQSRRFLAAWAITQFALLYAPFVFQRRLTEGLQFPLALLSVPALAFLVRHFSLHLRHRAALVALLAVVVFLPSSFSTVSRSVDAALQQPGTPFFFSAGESAALGWLRVNAEHGAVVLSGVGLGNDVVGWAERTAYAGHWANTVDLERKQREAVTFFSVMTDADRSAFAAAAGIDYVLVGPDERAIGGDGVASDAFPLVFASGDYAVYAAPSSH